MHRLRSPPALWGGMAGLIVPFTIVTAIAVLAKAKVALGEHTAPALLVWSMFLVELLPVMLARFLGLPIERTGGAAFILFELNGMGYAFVLMFWGMAGWLLGSLFNKPRLP